MPFFSRGSSTSDGPTSWRRPRTVKTIEQDEDQETTALPQLMRSPSSRSSSIFRLRTTSRTGEVSQQVLSSSSTSRAPSAASSRLSSRDAGSVLDQDSGRSRNLAQSLLMRGKMLKHSRSKLSLASLLPESQKTDPAPVVILNCPNHQNSPALCDCKFIPGHGYTSISAPFKFRHVTHSHPQHFRDLDRTNENDLVAEYSAVRAAQRSRPDLQGIKAEALHSRNSSSDTTRLGTPSTSGGTSPHLSSVPSLTSELSQDSLHALSMSSQPTRRHGRGSRSRESFSQPFIASRIPKIGDGPLTPPPRVSSRGAYTVDHRATTSKDSIASGHSNISETSTESYLYGAQAVKPPPTVPHLELNASLEKYFLQTSPLDTEPFSHSFSFNRLLSPVSEEDIGASALRASYASQAIRDVASVEDVTSSLSVRASTARTHSQASICTVVYAPNQNSIHSMEVSENASTPSNGPSSRHARRVSMKRSSTTNGLFSSWDDDPDSCDRNTLKLKKDIGHCDNYQKPSNVIGISPDELRLRISQEHDFEFAEDIDTSPINLNSQAMSQEQPTSASHERASTSQKATLPVRTRRRQNGPPSAPPKSTLPTPPPMVTSSHLLTRSQNSLIAASDTSRRSKIPLKNSAMVFNESPTVSNTSANESWPVNVSDYDVANRRDSHPRKRSTPRHSKNMSNKRSTALNSSSEQLPSSPKQIDPSLEHNSLSSIPKSTRRNFNGSSYMIFPPTTKPTLSTA